MPGAGGPYGPYGYPSYPPADPALEFEKRMADQAKARQALLNSAPKFDGKGKVKLWWAQLMRYWEDC